MGMYPKLDLYFHYKNNLTTAEYSEDLPDVTKKSTLENINYAANLAANWEVCMDIGGGSGNYLAALAKKFDKCLLIEKEKHPEQETLQSKCPNVSVYHTYIETYRADQKADFILLADVFEHILDIKSFVSQLSTLQKTDGIVYIMTPNPLVCGPATKSVLYYKIDPGGHVKQYTHSEIVSLMSNVGYILELSSFEETEIRQKIKLITFALSRRDKHWSKYFLYRVVRPITLPLLKTIYSVLERFTYHYENKERNNPYTTRTQNLVFRKIT